MRVLVASFTMLALSSLSKSTRYVAILYTGAIFFTEVDVRRAARSSPARRASPGSRSRANFDVVTDVMFRQTPRYDTPVIVSVLVLAGLVAALGLGARAARSRASRSCRERAGRCDPAAEHVSKWYGQVIGLNDVTVSVPPGITGLLGPNGAGKSTFMKLITGQLKPSKGAVKVLGEPIWDNPKLYFRIGFCPEQDAFYDRMTGLEWVTALVRLNGYDEADGQGRRRARARRPSI